MVDPPLSLHTLLCILLSPSLMQEYLLKTLRMGTLTQACDFSTDSEQFLPCVLHVLQMWMACKTFPCLCQEQQKVCLVMVLQLACLLENGVSCVMEQPDGGHPFCDSEVVQIRQESDGIKGQELLCQTSQCLQIIHDLCSRKGPFRRIVEGLLRCADLIARQLSPLPRILLCQAYVDCSDFLLINASLLHAVCSINKLYL